MNIFVTDSNPYIAARNLCDKHIPKMYLESCQMLCAGFDNGTAPYRKTHFNHPCTKWTLQSKQNYEWLLEHTTGIGLEYTFRYRKFHKSNRVLAWAYDNYHKLNLPELGLTKFAQAMPDTCKAPDPIIGYRNYYLTEKAYMAKWLKGHNPPSWWAF